MRRTAAAVATAVLAALVLAGPMASIGQARSASPIECAGAAGSSECALLDQLATQLGPLQPVLVLAGPTMAGLAPAVQDLAAQADAAGGVPTVVVAEQTEALLDQLAVLPASVRGLLPAAQLDGLTTTLEGLVAQLAAPVTGGQTGASGSKATPANTTGSASPASSSSAGPSLGGSRSGADNGTSPVGTTSPAIPDVPQGASLTLAPLGLPDFGFSQTIGLAPATELASSAASDAATQDVQLAIDDAFANASRGTRGTQVGIVITLSLLLFAAAFAAQAHQNRHAIPD